MLETHTSKLQQHFHTAAIHFPHIVSLFMRGIAYSLFLCCVRHHIKIQLHVSKFNTKKDLWFNAAWKRLIDMKWRRCGRKEEHYTHMHTKVYLKHKQHSVFDSKQFCWDCRWQKRDCTAGQTLHYEFYLLCFVVLIWNKNKV